MAPGGVLRKSPVSNEVTKPPHQRLLPQARWTTPRRAMAKAWGTSTLWNC